MPRASVPLATRVSTTQFVHRSDFSSSATGPLRLLQGWLLECAECEQQIETDRPTSPWRAGARSLGGVPPRAQGSPRLPQLALWIPNDLIKGSCSGSERQLACL